MFIWLSSLERKSLLSGSALLSVKTKTRSDVASPFVAYMEIHSSIIGSNALSMLSNGFFITLFTYTINT